MLKCHAELSGYTNSLVKYVTVVGLVLKVPLGIPASCILHQDPGLSPGSGC